MGTSSTWSFGRRVLEMTHVKLTGLPLAPDPNRLLFDTQVYDFKWDGNKANSPSNPFDVSNLPTPEFARYLISSVKFHCGHLFYLVDEDQFMERFAAFQQNPTEVARTSSLWFCHYLLVIAFGKSFLVRSTTSRNPPGSDQFVQAMQCMPDFTFFDDDPIEMIQVLCCGALYLQSVGRRASAYRMVRPIIVPYALYANGPRLARHCVGPWSKACILRCMDCVLTKRMCIGVDLSGGQSTCSNADFRLFKGYQWGSRRTA